MSVRSSVTLEASEMFLSRHMIFSLERAVVLAILEWISGFDPSLEMIAPRFLKLSTSSSLWHFILISLWKPFGLFVIIFDFSGPISILYLVVVVSRRSTRTPASSSFTTMSSAKRKLVISHPPMLTSWSSNVSHIILSGEVLKGVGENSWWGLSNSYCSSEPVSCAAIEQDCTLGLVIQIFNDSYDSGVHVVLPHSCPYGFVPYPV